MINQIEWLIERIVWHLLLFLIGLLTCINVISSCFLDRNEHAYYVFHSVIPVIIAEATLFGLFFVYIKIKNRCKLRITFHLRLLLLFAFILGCCFVLKMGIQPRADQRICLEIAQNMHKGDFEAFTKEGYLNTYPQQAGLILFYYVASFFLGSSAVLGLQIVNVFAYTCFIYCIYHITLLLWKDKTVAAVAALLTFSFVPLLFYTTFVYGTLPGLALSSFALVKALRYMRNPKIGYMVSCSIFTAASIIIKKNFMIPAIAILLVLFIYGICKRHYRAFLCMLLLLGTSFGFSKACFMTMNAISGQALSEGMPSIAWVVMGLQEGNRGCGWYNRYTINTYVDNDFDSQATAAQAKKDLEQELLNFSTNKCHAADFFYKKTVSQWGEPTFQSLFINNMETSFGERKASSSKTINWLVVRGLLPTFDLFLSLSLFGVMMFLLYDRKQIKLWELLPGIIFLGGFLFHLFWEAKGQYTITYYVLLFPYCAKGYYSLYHAMETAITRVNTRNVSQSRHLVPKLYHAAKPVTLLLATLLVLNIIHVAVPSAHNAMATSNEAYYYYLYNSKPGKNKRHIPIGTFTVCSWDTNLYLDCSLDKKEHMPLVFLNKNKLQAKSIRIKKEGTKVSFKFTKPSISFSDLILPKLREKEVKKNRLFYFRKGTWSFQKNKDGSYIITNPEGFVLSRLNDKIVYEPYDKESNLQKWKLHRISR